MATASDNPNVSVREMEEDLSCCICYNLLREPKDLDCPHVYCLVCLQGWVGKKPTIECPECRYISIVPQGGLENLKSNLRLKTMVEKYASRIEKQEDVQLCPNHAGERQHFYCLTCQTTVCHNCLEFKHPRQTHDINELKDIAELKMDEMNTKMGGIKEQMSRSKASEKNLSEAEMKLTTAIDKAKEDIKKHAQEIKSKVDAKEHDMIQIVETTGQQQMDLLKKKQNHTQDNTTQLQNAQTAIQNVLDSAADHVYMTQHATLVERIDRLCVVDHEAPSWDFDCLCFNPAPIPNNSNWLGDTSLHGNKICGLKFVHEFGQFQQAQGIAVNQDGLVAVVDSQAKKTEVFQSNGDGYGSRFCLTSDKKGTSDTTDTSYKICTTVDGKFYVTVSRGQIVIFSPSGKYLRSVQSYSNASIAASPDGTIITGNQHKQTITLLKCNDEKSEVTKTYKIDQKKIANIISNGTQIVYTTGSVGKVCAIDFTSGQALWAIDMVWPLGICYEPKTKTLLIAGGSKYQGESVIQQYCSATGRLISRLATGLHWPYAMTVTHDNKLLVADYNSVKVYEIQ